MPETSPRAHVCTVPPGAGRADIEKTIKSLRAKLNRWELEHLRQHSAELATRLEQAEEEIERLKTELVYAWRTADSWREDIDGLVTALEATGQQVGLTQGGELVTMTKAEAEATPQAMQGGAA